LIETRANFGFMLVGLILLWLVSPFLAMVSTDVGNIALYVAIGAALCLGAWSLSTERRVFLAAAAITVAAVACAIVAYLTGSALARFLLIGLEIVFWSICAWFVATHVLASGPVDKNRIAGAVCIYMIAAVIWAYLYTVINQLAPGSFNGLEAMALEKQIAELLYFSFVTLTTLGYGDMSPAHPFARWLAQAEAIFGQLYIAILIATLVGKWIARETMNDITDDEQAG
jgi:hypothetical protein